MEESLVEKKIYTKFNKTEIEYITKLFTHFQDNKTGIVLLSKILDSFKISKYDTECPTIYKIIQLIASETPEITLEQFLEQMEDYLGDYESENLKKIFNIMNNQNEQVLITKEDIVRLCNEVGCTDFNSQSKVSELFTYLKIDSKGMTYDQFVAFMDLQKDHV